MRLKTKSVDMVNGPLFKNMLVYTLPIIFTGLLHLLFNAADLIVIGQYCGGLPFAAMGSTGSLINLIVNLFMGLSVGVSVVVAQGIGAGDKDTVRNAVHTAFPLAAAGGAVLTFVGIFGAKYFLTLMGTPPEVLELAAVYMRIFFSGIIPILIFNFGAAILRAAGDTKSPFLYLTLAGALNVALNLIFVIFFGMDVDGVALATILTQALAAFLVVRALVKRSDICRLFIKEMKFHKAEAIRIMKIGLPAGMQGTIFSASNVIIQSGVNSFGDIAIAGNAAAANIEGFVYVSMNAFYQTAMNFIGQNVGAGKKDRVGKVLAGSLSLVAATGLAMGVGAFIFAKPLLSIYISGSSEAISYGLTRMTYICAVYFLCGMMDVMTGAIRGMGSSLAPMFIAVIGVCGVRLTWIYTVFKNPAYHSPGSLYVSYPVSWSATLIVQLIFYIIIKKRLYKKMDTRKLKIAGSALSAV